MDFFGLPHYLQQGFGKDRIWVNRLRHLADLRPVLACLCILSSGCFKEPATPPDRPQIDARLLGEWDCTSSEAASEVRALLTVLRFDAGQFYAEWNEGEKVERYRAYPGDLKGLAILNVTAVSQSANRYWSAVRPSFSADGSMTLALPAQRITAIADDDLSLSTLRREADLPSAWQTFARCVPHSG
jgi:hypothetical protein